MSDRGLIDPASCVYVDCVDDFVQRLSGFVRLLGLVLTCWREEETAIRCEGQSAKERLECIVGVDMCVFDSESSVGLR